MTYGQRLFSVSLTSGTLLLCASLLLPPHSQALGGTTVDVETIGIHVGKARFDGVLGALPYAFQIGVEGTGIDGVTVQTPNASHDLIEIDGEWQFVREHFASLDAICADAEIGCGTFVFTITAQDASTETATVSFDPGSADPHGGYAGDFDPAHGEVGVSTSPTLTWSCVDAPCGNFAWYLELFPISGPGPEYDEDILDPAATMWTPGPLAPDTAYRWWITAGSILDGGPVTMETVPGGDAFLYVAGYETTNEIEFTTGAGCPVTSALDGTRGEDGLGVFYALRDDVLGRTAAGREVTELYYRHAPEAVWLMLRYPELRGKTRDVLERLEPAVRGLVDGRRVILSREDVEAVDDLLDAYAARASVELRWTLMLVKQEIRSGARLSRIGVDVGQPSRQAGPRLRSGPTGRGE